MAKITYQNIPVEYKALVKKNLTVGDRFIIPRVSVKRLIPKRKIVKGITQRSQLPAVAVAWNELTSTVQDLWATVGIANGTTGYKAFTKEYILRLQNSLSPVTSPNIHRHGKVGVITIETPADDLTIRQDHPFTYYINKKVTGTKNQYTPYLIQEFITFPATLKISYKSNLTYTSANYIAKIYIEFVSNYQGRDIFTQKEIVFNLVNDWNTQEIEIENVFGVVRGYTMYIKFQNVQGTFYFDNVKFYHSGKNWVRDGQCNDIHQDFTKAFYQVAKHWIAENINEGANFESNYIDF